MLVRFSEVSEYLGELRLDPPPSGVVRLTHSWRNTNLQPVKLHYVNSGYVNSHGELVELAAFAGEELGSSPTSDQTTARATKMFSEVKAVCTELGLEVRAGHYFESTP